MPRNKFNGKIGGKPVKVIVIDKGWKKTYFAKPKDSDVDTPHFDVINNFLQVHEDSANGEYFRSMNINTLYSGSFYIGGTFAHNRGMDSVVLPMNPTAHGFTVDISPNGKTVSIPSGSEWCLMAFGTFGTWKTKKKKK